MSGHTHEMFASSAHRRVRKVGGLIVSLSWSHEAGAWALTGLQSTGMHRIYPSSFSRCQRRNSELSSNGYYCLSLLAGMGVRREFLLLTAPVVSSCIKHSWMKNKHQDTFFVEISLLSRGQQLLGTQLPRVECQNRN